MKKRDSLENIRHDFLSFLDLDFSQINASTKKAYSKESLIISLIISRMWKKKYPAKIVKKESK